MMENFGLAVEILTLSVVVPVVYFQFWRPCRYFRLTFVQSVVDTVCELVVVENTRFAVGIVMVCVNVILSEI